MKVIKTWTLYHLPDNGVYGPIGSTPNFHTEKSVYDFENHGYTHIVGYVMHAYEDKSELCRETSVLTSEIQEEFTENERVEYAIKVGLIKPTT